MSSDKFTRDINFKRRCDHMLGIQNRAFKIFEKKNRDYGDAFAKYGTIGVLVRMGDKISRLMNIEKTKIQLVEDESLKDTLLDLHNYTAMAIMVLEDNNLANHIDTMRCCTPDPFVHSPG